jgi:hypothetical protein
MSRPTVQSLSESDNYQLVESFSIDEMADFLAREAGLTSNSTDGAPKKDRKWLLGLSLGLMGVAFGWLIGAAFTSDQPDELLAPGWQLLTALISFFVVWLPLHEGIHAVVFKLLGAPKVGFGYSTKGMMVYAYSQRFVMTLGENAIVAAMPFLIISTLLVLLLVYVPELSLVWGFTLLLHTLGCMGDFILIKHAWTNRHASLYTYDDLDEKRTYYFKKL